MPATDGIRSVKPLARGHGIGHRGGMSTPDLPTRHSDDAHADDAAPTDAVTDDVREDAAEAEEDVDLDDHTGGTADGTDSAFPAADGHA